MRRHGEDDEPLAQRRRWSAIALRPAAAAGRRCHRRHRLHVDAGAHREAVALPGRPDRSRPGPSRRPSSTDARMAISMAAVSRTRATLWAMSSAAHPHVLIIGGFLTEPLNYRPLRRRLLARGAARVTIAPVHLPDWAVMGFVGMGPLLLRGGRAIREARRASPTRCWSSGTPWVASSPDWRWRPPPSRGTHRRCGRRRRLPGHAGDPTSLRPRVPWRHPGAWPPSTWRASLRCLLRPDDRLPDGGLDARAPSRGRRPAPRRPCSTGCCARLSARGPVSRRRPRRSDRSRLDGARHLESPMCSTGWSADPGTATTTVIDRWWPDAVEEWQPR